MDVKIKCTVSEGWFFLMVLCSFSFFIPYDDRDMMIGMGYGALPTWGSEKGEGQHIILTGLLLDFIHPQQNAWIDEEPDNNFLAQGWQGYSRCAVSSEGGEESRGWDAQNGDWGTCTWHCVTTRKQPELATYRKKNLAIGMKLLRFVGSYIYISSGKTTEKTFRSLQEEKICWVLQKNRIPITTKCIMWSFTHYTILHVHTVYSVYIYWLIICTNLSWC